MNGKIVSIILPCYNEAEHLLNSIRLLTEHSLGFKFQYEFIFVDDKSTDATPELLKKLELSFGNAQFIYQDVNKGRGAAVKSGFKVGLTTFKNKLNDNFLSQEYSTIITLANYHIS